MIKKFYTDIDVVTAAKQRIKNVFETSQGVELSVSGGKDSICLNDLIFKMCQTGEVDKNKLVVDFIDEEAIYPCVEQIVKNIRLQWLTLGVEFRWWCIEVKHFNCFNQLSNDETFICWDRYKKDVWIREKPKFAITDNPLLNKRKDSYQMFLPRLNSDRTIMIGVRAAESIQRMNYLAKNNATDKIYPIYDWTDKDVWRYIKQNNLDIPNAYMYMYQVGLGKNKMRISQFFSIDTAKSLVQMCEFYPELFDKICKREPNAYLAMLYYDTELFRRSKESKQAKKDDEIDYKAKVLELLNNDDFFASKSQKNNQKDIKRLVMLHSALLDNKIYKQMYNTLIGGDPKHRNFRALYTQIFGRLNKMEDMK